MYNIFKQPAKKLKQRQAQEQLNHDIRLKNEIIESFKEILPELLEKHDLEVRERYRADRERYLLEIKASVQGDITEELNQIKVLGIQYEALVISARDVLREKIIKIYVDNKDAKKIPILQREKLDQFYKDYKALNGNIYLYNYYH